MALTQLEFDAIESKMILQYEGKKAWLSKLASSLLAEFIVDDDTTRQQELLDHIHATRTNLINMLLHPEILEYMTTNNVTENITLTEIKSLILAIPKTINQAKTTNGKSKLQDLIDAYL